MFVQFLSTSTSIIATFVPSHAEHQPAVCFFSLQLYLYCLFLVANQRIITICPSPSLPSSSPLHTNTRLLSTDQRLSVDWLRVYISYMQIGRWLLSVWHVKVETLETHPPTSSSSDCPCKFHSANTIQGPACVYRTHTCTLVAMGGFIGDYC